MKINQITIVEEKKRLDPKCWSGYKKQGTKMKGGVRVNNCVPNESVEEGENWSKHNNPRAGGMSQKSVKSYRRSHPGSKIQTAVTTKPSKLKKGSKAAKRRASFCARMRGMKKHRTGAKTARDPNSNINKSLRRWHCESIEDMQQLIMIAEQQINEAKNFAQQAAIAINMKKHHKKPKSEGVAEGSLEEDEYDKMLRDLLKARPDLTKKYAKDVQKSKDIESGKELNKLVKKNPGVLKTYSDAVKRDKKLGVAEGHADQQRKIFKKNGKPVGEVGIDRESSPGNGQWYMTCYGVVSYGGYDSYEEAVEELKHCLKQGIAEESKGLWANIHAKQKRIKNGSGEHMRKPGSKGAPTAQSFKDSVSKKKYNESVELNELAPNDQWYIVMRGNLDFHGIYHGKGDDVTGPLPKVQASAQLHKLHPYDSNWTIVPASSMQKQVHENSSPQAAAAKKALNRGSKKMPGMSNIVQQLVHEIKPDGTIVVKNSAETKTMNNIKKILELGGGKNFDVVMAPPGPGWHSAKPVPVPDEPDDKKEVAEVKDDEDDGLIGGRYTPEQWAKMIANLKRKAQEQDAKKKQQEQPKDLGESSVELNNILTLSGNNK